jgi:hypothetical protein
MEQSVVALHPEMDPCVGFDELHGDANAEAPRAAQRMPAAAIWIAAGNTNGRTACWSAWASARSGELIYPLGKARDQ